MTQTSGILALVLDPSAPRTLYALSSGNLKRSTDGGQTARERVAGLPITRSGGLMSLALDPSQPSRLYAGTLVGLYISLDGGEQWEHQRLGASTNHIVVDPSNPATIYIAHASALGTSRDRGDTWTDVAAGYVTAMAVDPLTSVAYAVSALGDGHVILTTSDRGATWSPLASALPYPSFLAIQPGSSDVLYAGSGGDLFKSETRGQGWRSIRGGLNRPEILDVVADPADAATLFVLTYRGVLKSVNAGKTWSDAKLQHQGNIAGWATRWHQLTIGPSRSSQVFAYNLAGASRSQDGGETWGGIAPGSGVRGITVDPSDPANVYAVLSNGLSRSTNGGTDWTAIGTGELPLGYYGWDGTTIAVDPVNHHNVYAAGSGGIVRSFDGGAKWETVFRPSYGAEVYFRKLLVDPKNPSTIYALAYDSLHRSDNGGRDWNAILGRPSSGHYVDLELDPRRPTRLYLATSTGLLRSEYRGDEWTAFNEGLPVRWFESLSVDSTGTVYAGTLGGLYANTPRHVAPAVAALSITLRTSAGNYISARNCGGLHLDGNANVAGPCETFALYDLNAGQLTDGDLVHLQADDGGYVVAEYGGSRAGGYSPVNVNRGVPAEWETFVIRRANGPGVIQSGDSIHMQSMDGSFVAVDGGGQNGCQCDSRVSADRDHAREWETFVMTVQR